MRGAAPRPTSRIRDDVPRPTSAGVPRAHHAMTVLAIRDLTIRVAGRTLIEGAELGVDPGRKVGLVGRNGAGKSTLLRAVTGDLAPDGGEIRLAARARLGHVAQEAPGGEASLLETVLAADAERAALLAEAEGQPDPHRLGEIHDRLIAIGADSAPSRAATILSGLGFDAAAQARPVGEYSGGWRMRVALARALFLEPDLLLLDEPTNHLDLEAALWLEGWLARFPGAAIVVSHDRGLLDRCVDAIAHLDRGKIALYPGGFEDFVRVRAERQAQQAAQNERIAAERQRIQAFVDRFRYKASKARQAQSRLKALERMPSIEAVVEDHVTRFAFPEPTALPPPVVSFRRAATGYDGRAVLSEMTLRLDQDDRVALLGANGNGKSTLAKLLAGRLDLLGGEQHRAPKLRVGYFAQHQADELDPEGTPLSHIQALMPKATETACRSQIARFGLDSERAETRVAALSGGEKARLLLALCTRDAPQLLILDEPTNHLDIDAREALVKALAEYGGAVLLITHDPHLVELVADRLWLVADGTVRPFDGDLEEYRALLAERARAAAGGGADRVEGAPTRRDERRERAEARTALAPLRERLRRVEAALAKLSAEAGTIDAALNDPRLYAGNNADLIARATARRAAIARETEALEAEWLELSEKLDAAAA
jgi:ATP-binding cassette, subfamily F, member 3